MSPEQQRIAIAEWCGWAKCREFNPCSGWHDYSKNDGHQFCENPPDYLNDLNAMHEAEKRLQDKQVARYISEIWSAMCRYNNPHGYIGTIHASASIRAEALLRTIGKWVET